MPKIWDPISLMREIMFAENFFNILGRLFGVIYDGKLIFPAVPNNIRTYKMAFGEISGEQHENGQHHGRKSVLSHPEEAYQ